MRQAARAAWEADYNLFLEQLKAARKSKGLTQREVAKLIGKPPSWVAESESGRRRVDIVDLTRFARVYKKPLKFFAPFL